MPKVVSNTTPLISLLKLNHLEILQELYTHVHIPMAVFNEIELGKKKGYYKDLSEIDWISIVEIQDSLAVKYFLDLDDGEAEAIVLATELKADLILLDEKLGRFHAKHVGLKVTGTIGVLMRAKEKGLVAKLKPLLDELTDKEVWISEKLKQDILKPVNSG